MANIDRDPVDIQPPRAIFNGETIEITPENSHCVVHAIGKVAVGDIVRSSSDFDHIRVLLKREDLYDSTYDICLYLFRGAKDDMLFDNVGFEKALEKLKTMGAPIDFNAQSVDDDAMNQFLTHIEKSGNFGSEDLDVDLNNMIDEYRRKNGGDSKD